MRLASKQGRAICGACASHNDTALSRAVSSINLYMLALNGETRNIVFKGTQIKILVCTVFSYSFLGTFFECLSN